MKEKSPTTEAGQRLLELIRDEEGMTPWQEHDLYRPAIVAIEDEAAAFDVERLAQAMRAATHYITERVIADQPRWLEDWLSRALVEYHRGPGE